MKKAVLSTVTVSAPSAIPAIPADRLTYLSNVKRLSERFYLGYRYILSPNVRPTAWKTIHQPLADGFVEYYANSLCQLGVGFGAYTSYAMQDIDRGSPHHPCNDPIAFKGILDTLAQIGLTTPVIIQSSLSGGIHIYYFFDRDLNTFRVASLISVKLIQAGFEIKNGHLELFPNAKSFADEDRKSNHIAHRLPLQPDGGGAILDRAGNPLMCGANLNCETQLEAFLQMAKASALGNDIAKIERQLDPIYQEFKSDPSRYQHFDKKDKSEAARQWRKNLQTMIGIGWTGYHQTNSLIPKFLAYGMVFLNLDDSKKDLYEWAIENIPLAPGYNQYCRHQHEIEARIRDWINSSIDNQFYVRYCGYPPRSDKRNNFISKFKTHKATVTSKSEIYQRKRVDTTLRKLESIVDLISEIPNRIGDLIEMIQAKSKESFGSAFSKTTLYKPHYKTIWMKLLDRNKTIDLVPVTSITTPSMEYLTQTPAESTLESSPFCNTNPSVKTLKPVCSEDQYPTFAPMKCLWSDVGGCGDELAAKGVNPVQSLLDSNSPIPNLYQSIELQTESLSIPPSQLGASVIPDRPDSDINPQPDPIDSHAKDLISFTVKDRVQLIDSPNPEHQFGIVFRVLGASATVVWEATKQVATYSFAELRLVDRFNLIDRPNLTSELSNSSLQQSVEQDRLTLSPGCLVCPVDIYHVHGAHTGIVTSIESWGVYVVWEDESSGRYAIYELKGCLESIKSHQ